ncbi:O-methyltransferase involved in polyketide biosynthesis [Allocatelliglobosispora scoriae]|uniref:O-methyltransferase involved in polyketide biosynthesis n=1 Tax=Allocatelliglobosispora scoriae TaxID=643052 RepID=A0A841BQX6_9ACTN|nr:class I SAM-dependent methyltransferase [Allocatelliglobosispora scoriae]MBB5869152.1 O-methyltransferase involved in polyketide biosynthesis [Allocatelliglobosispora scoriae]
MKSIPVPETFTGVRVTALIELYLRWLDSRRSRSILRDRLAAAAVERLDFDFDQFKSMKIGQYAVSIRSRLMDEWITQFLAGHPDAVVLDLGSGLDSRATRVDPPAGHPWFDVDLPDVLAIAEQLYPPRHEHTFLGTSVLDPGWLDGVPADRPVIAVADSLLGFLGEEEVRSVLRRIVDHFPHGEIAFNITSSAVQRQRDKRPVPLFEKYGIVERWWLDDPRGLTRLEPRLSCVEVVNQMQTPLLAQTPLAYRMLCAVIRAVPSWNNSGWVLRYRF